MRLFLTALFALLLNEANAAESIAINLAPTDTSFQVSLPANPSTGYQWSVKNYDKQLLTLVSSKFAPAKTQMVGAGGTMNYKFELIKGVPVPQKISLIFSYARSWEPEKELLTTVTVSFQPTSLSNP